MFISKTTKASNNPHVARFYWEDSSIKVTPNVGVNMRGQSRKLVFAQEVWSAAVHLGGLLNKYSFTDLLSMSMDYYLLCFLKHIFTLIFFLTSGYQVTFSLIWGRKLIFPYLAPAFFSKFSRLKAFFRNVRRVSMKKKVSRLSEKGLARLWEMLCILCRTSQGAPEALYPFGPLSAAVGYDHVQWLWPSPFPSSHFQPSYSLPLFLLNPLT